ncbi:MAG: M91 family zinc metallopeptidase [bacterium]|nr:M91 family zinc metallopeptidase [bacterium]
MSVILSGISDTAAKVQRWQTDKFGSDEERLQNVMQDNYVSSEQTAVISGTDGVDNIDICQKNDNSYEVSVNGHTTKLSAEEARCLMIDGGAGDDVITVRREQPEDDSAAPQVPADPYDELHHGKRAIYISGGAGNDTITASADMAMGMYITGGKGNDIIVGGSGSDTIIDNYGSNNINGGAGDDTIIAKGKDESAGLLQRAKTLLTDKGVLAQIVEGGLGNDTIITGDGHDIITDSGGDTTVYAGGGNDTITVADGNSSLYGEDGDDVINGGSGRDYIEGGRGNDKIFGNAGGDVIYAGKGNDYVEGGDGNDFINAGRGDDEVHGGAGRDVIFGLSGNDKLFGGGDADTIIAGKGRDTVDGGEGSDTIRTTSGLYGNDTVLNAQPNEDIKTLNPVHVPLNFFVADTDRAFRANMRDNLEAFASIEPGQAMFKGMERALHPVFLTSTDDANGYCAQLLPTGDAILRPQANGELSFWRNVGSGSIVKINPAFIEFGASDDWSEQNTMVILAHELAHAYNNSTGTMDETIYNDYSGERLRMPDKSLMVEHLGFGEVKGAEFQAVGLHKDSSLTANPYGMTENDYRQYFHMPKRTSYISHVSRQQQ